MKLKINMRFFILLFLLFMLLKITGLINWSWWWVASPIWVPIVIGLVIVGVTMIIMHKLF
jgi:hypothetical protein